MENEILDDSILEPEIKLVPASKGKRLVNYVIDQIIVALAYAALIILANGMGLEIDIGEEPDVSQSLQANLLTMTIMVFYYILLEGGMQGKSIGKVATRTRVVTLDGRPLEMNDAFIRSISRIVPFEPFSFLGQRPDGWHDRWSKTMVIDEDLSTLPKF